MEVRIEYPVDGVATVAIRGQLDIDTAPTLEAAFDELLTRAANRIVVDLTRLDFCDSIGLSTLVVAYHHCVRTGGWLRLAGPTPFLKRLLVVVGIADTVPMYRTADGARTGDPAELITDHKDAELSLESKLR